MLHPELLKCCFYLMAFDVIQLVFVFSQIPLSHFSSEEVSTWSALNSPRVVELFGAVREGLNAVLFMDLKPGKLTRPENSVKKPGQIASKMIETFPNTSSLLGPAPERDDLSPRGSGSALPPSVTRGTGTPAQQKGASPGCQRCVLVLDVVCHGVLGPKPGLRVHVGFLWVLGLPLTL